jgi:hypothetical protein
MITVDYSQDPNEVFTNLAIYQITEQNSLDIIVHAVDKQTEVLSCPSWVPRWHVKCVVEPFEAQFTPTDVDALATSWFVPTGDPALVSSTGDELIPEQPGFEICKRAVHSTGPRDAAWPMLRVRAHLLDVVVGMAPKFGTGPDIVLPAGQLPEAFCNKKACDDCMQDGSELPKASEIEEASHRLRIAEQQTAFKDIVRHYGVRKLPFLTRQSMGFTHDWVVLQSGDTIWALPGLGIPVLLREIEGHFILMGECYLFRATLPHPCAYCGLETKPWSMVTEVIDIW